MSGAVTTETRKALVQQKVTETSGNNGEQRIYARNPVQKPLPVTLRGYWCDVYFMRLYDQDHRKRPASPAMAAEFWPQQQAERPCAEKWRIYPI